MNEDIKSMYRYFLTDDYSIEDGNRVIEFVYSYSTQKGRFFCWHNWVQFDVVPYGWNMYISSTKNRCTKCGKIRGTGRSEEDPNLIDYSRRITYG